MAKRRKKPVTTLGELAIAVVKLINEFESLERIVAINEGVDAAYCDKTDARILWLEDALKQRSETVHRYFDNLGPMIAKLETKVSRLTDFGERDANRLDALERMHKSLEDC